MTLELTLLKPVGEVLRKRYIIGGMTNLILVAADSEVDNSLPFDENPFGSLVGLIRDQNRNISGNLNFKSARN